MNIPSCITHEPAEQCHAKADEKKHIDGWQRLQTIVALNFDYFSWLLFYGRCVAESGNASGIAGLTLSRHELFCLGIDCEELLAQLIAGDCASSWPQIIEKFDYLTFEEEQMSAAPAEPCAAAKLLRVHQKPLVDAFPHALLINILYRLCQRYQCSCRDFLPPYYGRPCEDPQRFARSLMSGECDPRLAARELDLWRLRVNERVRILSEREAPPDTCLGEPASDRELLLLLSPENIHALQESDPRIQREIPRPLLAKIIRRSCRTIRRWETCGTAGEILWPSPRRINENAVHYFLPFYLSTIKQLVPRPRDPERDRQLRDEIIGQKYAD